MMYLRVYGEKKCPKADVVICDSVADVPSRGDGCFSIIPAYYGGLEAEPGFLVDLRASASSSAPVALGDSAVGVKSIADLHAAALIEDLDAASGALRGALRDVEESGAWLVPPHGRSAVQEAAVDSFQYRREDVEDYIANMLHDRYGILANVTLDPVSL